LTISHIDHLTVFVSDLDVSMRWYSEALGFHIAYSGTLGTGLYGGFIDVGATMLNLIARPDLGPLISEQHVAFRVGDLDRVVAALGAKGVEFDQDGPEVLPEGYIAGQRYIECRDPDGIRLEFVERSESYLESHSQQFTVEVP